MHPRKILRKKRSTLHLLEFWRYPDFGTVLGGVQSKQPLSLIKDPSLTLRNSQYVQCGLNMLVYCKVTKLKTSLSHMKSVVVPTCFLTVYLLVVLLLGPQVVQWDSASCRAGSAETGGCCRGSPGRGPLPRAALLLSRGGHTAARRPRASRPSCILFLGPQEEGQGSQERKRERPKGEPARPQQSLCLVDERWRGWWRIGP